MHFIKYNSTYIYLHLPFWVEIIISLFNKFHLKSNNSNDNLTIQIS